MSKENKKLLFDSQPIVVVPELAARFGLNEAIVLQQIHYWIEINRQSGKNSIDGYWWTYNTYTEWQSQFPFWSESTVKRIIANLEKKGVVISGTFNKVGFDRTKWYRIDYAKIECLSSTDDNTECVPEQNETHDETESSTRSGQNDTMHDVNLTRASCQNEPMHDVNLTRPIPETTHRLDTETNTDTLSLDEFETLDDRFTAFWSEYPRKQKKPETYQAFKRLNPDRALFEIMLSAVIQQKQGFEWQKEDGHYIPQPQKWLDGRRWEDEPSLPVRSDSSFKLDEFFDSAVAKSYENTT